MLHTRIIRASAPFGHNPGNVLRRVFDVTGFAVDTVLRINLEAFAATLFYYFINACRAIPLGRLIKLRQIFINRYGCIRKVQMYGLILFVIRTGEKQPIHYALVVVKQW